MQGARGGEGGQGRRGGVRGSRGAGAVGFDWRSAVGKGDRAKHGGLLGGSGRRVSISGSKMLSQAFPASGDVT